MSITRLDSGQKHFLHLVAKDAGVDGWATASPVVYRMFEKTLPPELVELESAGDVRRVRLKPLGQQLLDAMDWL